MRSLTDVVLVWEEGVSSFLFLFPGNTDNRALTALENVQPVPRPLTPDNSPGWLVNEDDEVEEKNESDEESDLLTGVVAGVLPRLVATTARAKSSSMS